MTTLRWGAATDVGLVRAQNEDRYLCAFPVFVVADGMGGHQGGEVAAQTAIDTIEADCTEDASADGLRTAIQHANNKILEQSQAETGLKGMGTTVTALALVPWGDSEVLTIANVGDSRTYALRMGELEQITEDHTVVGEMVKLGLLAAADAEGHEKSHIITRALGIEPDVKVDAFQVTPYKGERYLLCSDGLTKEVGEGQIASVLRRIADPEDAAKELVTMALSHGGSDNVTVVIVDVVDDGGRAAAASTQSSVDELDRYGADETDLEREEAESSPTPDVAPAKMRKRVEDPNAQPILTFRVVLFVVALVALILGGLGMLRWYATSGYIVQSDEQGQILILKGRQGGVLWWNPEVVRETPYDLEDLRVENRDDIETGRQVGSEQEALDLLTTLVTAGVTQSTTSIPIVTTTTVAAP